MIYVRRYRVMGQPVIVVEGCDDDRASAMRVVRNVAPVDSATIVFRLRGRDELLLTNGGEIAGWVTAPAWLSASISQQDNVAAVGGDVLRDQLVQFAIDSGRARCASELDELVGHGQVNPGFALMNTSLWAAAKAVNHEHP